MIIYYLNILLIHLRKYAVDVNRDGLPWIAGHPPWWPAEVSWWCVSDDYFAWGKDMEVMWLRKHSKLQIYPPFPQIWKNLTIEPNWFKSRETSYCLFVPSLHFFFLFFCLFPPLILKRFACLEYLCGWHVTGWSNWQAASRIDIAREHLNLVFFLYFAFFFSLSLGGCWMILSLLFRKYQGHRWIGGW